MDSSAIFCTRVLQHDAVSGKLGPRLLQHFVQDQFFEAMGFLPDATEVHFRDGAERFPNNSTARKPVGTVEPVPLISKYRSGNFISGDSRGKAGGM